jgi:hypothetical protein
VETFKKRLKALEAKTAQKNLTLTEEQLIALKKTKEEKEAEEKIKTYHLWYIGAYNTFYNTAQPKPKGITKRLRVI